MMNKGDLTVRQAAVVAGFGYLLNPVPYAEFALMPQLVVAGHVDQTVANIAAHPGVLLGAIFCYLANFVGDIVIAWALFYLFAPVHRALSLLAALFRLVYTAVGVVAFFKLVTVYRLVSTPGAGQLDATVDLLLRSFRYEWSFSILIFVVHLFLIGWLIYRARYVNLPRIFGPLMALDALCLVIVTLQPYLYPQASVGWVFWIAFIELIFGWWLLFMGWRIRPSSVA